MPHAPVRLLALGLLHATKGWADRTMLEGTSPEPEGTLESDVTLQPGATPAPE